MERLTLDETLKLVNKATVQMELDNCKECSENYKQIAEYLEELKSYKEAEEQGLLVRLPCKVEDTVWDNDFGHPVSYEIKAFSYGYCDSYVESNIEDEIIFYYENYNGSITGAFPMSELGKTVFLTREEAVKKLEETKK
nr:MAG TPA: hypothetical protein [Caudoviricetes sp.]